MRNKAVIIIFFYSLLFIFYPGDHLVAKRLSDFKDKLEVKGERKKLFRVVYLENKTLPQVSAKALFIVDMKDFIPLYEKNFKKKVYPASTTKIITALVARDLYNLEDIIEVKREIKEGRVMNLEKGERISVENLLYGLLIHSANDAAFALADAVGYEKFVFYMNQKAKEIGMKNTNFTNPAGFDHPLHYTTAYDLALASYKLLQDPFLRKVVGIKEIVVSDVEFKRFHRLLNVNRLLGDIPGVAGLKTGYTPAAGENLISLYKTSNSGILLVVLGSQDRFSDTQKLIYWLKENIREKVVEF